MDRKNRWMVGWIERKQMDKKWMIRCTDRKKQMEGEKEGEQI